MFAYLPVENSSGWWLKPLFTKSCKICGQLLRGMQSGWIVYITRCHEARIVSTMSRQEINNPCQTCVKWCIPNVFRTFCQLHTRDHTCIRIHQRNTQYCRESRVTEGAYQQKHLFDATTGGQGTNHFLELAQFLSMLFFKSLQAHVGSGLIVCHVPGSVYDLSPSSDTGKILKEQETHVFEFMTLSNCLPIYTHIVHHWFEKKWTSGKNSRFRQGTCPMHWRILGTVLVELVPPPSSPAVGPDQLAFSDVPLPEAVTKLESVSISTPGPSASISKNQQQ